MSTNIVDSDEESEAQESTVIDVKVNPAYEPIFTTDRRYVVIKGAMGSGKSRAVTQYLISCLMTRKKFRCLVMHKYYESIRTTVFPEIKDTLSSYGFSSYFKFKESPFEVTHIETGNQLIFKGLDDAEKLKSMSGIDMIWWEEATMFSQHEFIQANSRMRGNGKEHPYKFIMTFNPVDELHWLKSTFFDEGNPYDGESLILETTMKDNEFLDDEYKQAQMANAIIDPAWGRINVDGEWGRISTDDIFYKRFDIKSHTSDDIKYDKERPLWLSFDFNVMPSCTLLLYQLQSDTELWQVDEITLKSPRNNTKAICEEFKRRYPNHGAGIIVTGDPAGKHDDTRSEKGFNDYTIIKNELRVYNPTMKVPTKAPHQKPRGNFINSIFSGLGDLSIMINSKCRKTIEDLMYQRETPDGKDKPKVRKDGVTYEKLGHASDAFDYMVTTVWAKNYEDFLKGPMQMKYRLGKNTMPKKYSF